jgi:hypothetical protein
MHSNNPDMLEGLKQTTSLKAFLLSMQPYFTDAMVDPSNTFLANIQIDFNAI